LIWIVEQFLTEGLIFIAGRPKIGKSWLALQLAIAVSTGTSFLGFKTNRCNVLYLSYEDNLRRIQQRIKRLNIPADASLWFNIAPKKITKEVEVILMKYVIENKIGLLIIDTVARAYPVDPKDSEKASEAFSELQRFAIENHICILLVDHHRKGSQKIESNLVDDIMGSTTKVGIADAIIGMYKINGEVILNITGRDVEEKELNLKKDITNSMWVLSTDPGMPKPDTNRYDVFETIAEFEEQGVLATNQSIAEILGIDKCNVSRELRRLLSDGMIYKLPKIKHQQPYTTINPISDNVDNNDNVVCK
jgi:hypothetical protein